MKIKGKEVEEKPIYDYLDHWLYELRRIYDDTKDDNPYDWVVQKKNQRINLINNTVTKMVLKIINDQTNYK